MVVERASGAQFEISIDGNARPRGYVPPMKGPILAVMGWSVSVELQAVHTLQRMMSVRAWSSSACIRTALQLPYR
jgi:hypothetical protein